ncbi:MAG TPA: hypothetical protein VJ833_11180 [Rhodanobacteraceae bacterium]|nr:hypothetical protein [Rhodanobacteraceae bacterium]
MATDPVHAHSRRLQWRAFPAVAIIAMGILFLANNLGYNLAFLDRGNWWAVIILLAASAPLTHAYERYRAQGKVDADVMCSVLSATAVVLVGVLFIFELDWGTWWPLFVILGGLFTLIPRHRRCRDHEGYDVKGNDATIKR